MSDRHHARTRRPHRRPPAILSRINVPVYASPLTRGLIEVKLKSHKLLKESTLCTIQMRDTIDLAPFIVDTFHVSHSVPDGIGLAVKTPLGTIVHSGDFKFDPSPVDGQLTDFAKLADLGASGVLALLSDSTNADTPGSTPSEETITDSFARVFALAEGRVIVLASNIAHPAGNRYVVVDVRCWIMRDGDGLGCRDPLGSVIRAGNPSV
jgi:ribonuclease J